MIKAVFFDIDGTLTNSKGRILPSTRKAIKKAQAAGIYCGVATGRGPSYLSEAVKGLELDMFVTYNGQLVYTAEKDIYAAPFQPAALQPLILFAEQNKRQMLLCARNHMEGSAIMNMGNHRWARRLFRRLDRFSPIHHLSSLLQSILTHHKQNYSSLAIVQEPVFQCVMLSAEKETSFLQHSFPLCHFTRSNPYMVDIIPAGGSKIVGIEKIISALGCSLDEVMAFGDSWNDREMLTGVGLGIAMGNARSDVQELAADVTDTNDNHGIYHAMCRYKVIDEGV